MSSSKARTRFAPSPTGYMHVGNLRTALYSYLLAKSKGGSFILRIEDTDRERFTQGAVEIIYDTLKATGLNWDEGPLKGGPFGPYIQSERKSSYIEHANKLISMGKAYYCFCSKERLASLKENNRNSMYDGHCRDLSEKETEQSLSLGMPFVIRQKMPDKGKTTYEDLVYGKVEIDNSELEDQILIKSDKLPTYNFANVIDDHHMQITHIVRGNEYLVSTPKYDLLYEAFGWEPPFYVHLPLIMSSPTEKLSKRTGSASFQDLVGEGYLPQAILNYVALLGWSPGSTREIFSLEELVEEFDISHINRSPSIFDKQKLSWLNGEYLKNMDPFSFYELVLPWLEKSIKKNIDLRQTAFLLQSRILTLSESETMTDFFDSVPDHDISLYVNKKMKTDTEISLRSLKLAGERLLSQEDFSNEALYACLCELASSNGLKNSQMLWPLRTAITGKAASPGGATEIAHILGKDETIKRISDAVSMLENNERTM